MPAFSDAAAARGSHQLAYRHRQACAARFVGLRENRKAKDVGASDLNLERYLRTLAVCPQLGAISGLTEHLEER